MKTKDSFIKNLLIAGCISGAAIPANANTYYVSVNGSHFSPAAISIEVGDTVVWVNLDDLFSHTTTSNLAFTDPDYWNGYLIDYGDAFGKIFNNVGVFTYYDQADTGTGSVTVTPPVAAGIVLEQPRQQGNQFAFDASGLTAGDTNILQYSTNLISWTDVSTNVADASTMSFSVTIDAPAKFFRLIELQPLILF